MKPGFTGFIGGKAGATAIIFTILMTVWFVSTIDSQDRMADAEEAKPLEAGAMARLTSDFHSVLVYEPTFDGDSFPAYNLMAEGCTLRTQEVVEILGFTSNNRVFVSRTSLIPPNGSGCRGDVVVLVPKEVLKRYAYRYRMML